MEQYFVNYASLEQQRWMVSDRPRTDAFAAAIKEVVKPGDVVIDVGAGTGVLSILAAKAGARRVIGVEKSGMAQYAKELIEQNKLSDRIEIFHGAAENLKIDESADVIISEWLGHMAFVENMFQSVKHVRDIYLKPDGIMLPSSVNLFLAPIDNQDLFYDCGPGFWQKKNIHEINFSHLTERELQMGHSSKLKIPDNFLLSDGVSIKKFKTDIAKSGDEWGGDFVDFIIQRDGELNGFVGWFSTELSKNITLDTSPKHPTTHWEQTYFPFHPIKVKAGQKIRVDYYMNDPFEGSRMMEVTLRADKYEIKYLVD